MLEASQSVWITGAMAASFALVHIFIGKLRFLDRTPRSAWLSFSGGVAVAYVFLNILPTLSAQGDAFGQALRVSDAIAERYVFSLALIGLAASYGLERAIINSRHNVSNDGQPQKPAAGIFWAHTASAAILTGIVSYLLSQREDAALSGLLIFFIAMLLHFVSADFGSRLNQPELYDRYGRWILTTATLAGWLIGVTTTLSALLVGCLFAFVAGGVILTVLKEELPAERQSAFLPFFVGVIVYSALMLGTLHLSAG